MADAVDAGQAAGEIATANGEINRGSRRYYDSEHLPATLADIGVTAKAVSEARALRRAFTEEELAERQHEGPD